MANTRNELVNRFIAFNGEGKVQSAIGVPQPNSDIDTRDKCTITREEVIVRRDVRDCRNEDLADSQLITRAARYTLTYAEITPQLFARWFAWFAGGSASPTGSQANEVQTVTVAGDGTLAMTLEGRTATTKLIESTGLTAALLQAALTAARMYFIHPGDVVVTGTGPYTLTFPETGRLGRANLPIMVGTGGFSVAAGSNGSQRYHALTRATSRIKKRFSFLLGYEDDTDTLEKYADYVCETFQPQASLTGDPSLIVTVLGPWEYDSLEPTYTVPDCINPEALRTEDCKIEINGAFETGDLNSMANNLNDNIPLDRLSAFPYDGMDVESLRRGKNPTYGSTASLFGISDAASYILAQNERTQDPVEIVQHYGLPGNRFSLIYPNAKVRFQNNREDFVGAVEFAAINLEFVPLVDGVDPPIEAEAYIDQAAQFLTSSV